jgi:hypothetical protein
VGLGDVFAGEISVDECWDMLMHLPRDSPLTSALAADPEFASDAKPGPPSWTEFGPVVQALAANHDLLAAIYSAITKAKIPPYPRPANPVRKKRMAELRAKHEWLKARLLPEKE